jgi:hypothetical protein
MKQASAIWIQPGADRMDWSRPPPCTHSSGKPNCHSPRAAGFKDCPPARAGGRIHVASIARAAAWPAGRRPGRLGPAGSLDRQPMRGPWWRAIRAASQPPESIAGRFKGRPGTVRGASIFFALRAIRIPSSVTRLRTDWTKQAYCPRNALTGLTEAARRAGKVDATSAKQKTAAEARIITKGSNGLT